MNLRSGALFVGRFEIDRLVARGGMGVIYRAQDRNTGQWIALKLLLNEEVTRGAEVDRFIREANLLAQLHHPSIVGYVAHGQSPEGRLYLATDWLEGEDLARRLATRGLTIAESLTCIRCATVGLQVAHERGIVHRDIKPGNLFLRDCRTERTIILDFGIARPELVAKTLTDTGVPIGTPSFMSPEQARGERNVGPTADIFSLGCVLFQCLTGRPPFVADQAMADHAIAVLSKILRDEAPSVRSIRPDVPESIDDLLKRMLAKNPLQRPRDAAELLDALTALGKPLSGNERASVQEVLAVSMSGQGQKLISVIVCVPVQPTQPGSEAFSKTNDDKDAGIDLDCDEPTISIPAEQAIFENEQRRSAIAKLTAEDEQRRSAIAEIARSFGAQISWLIDGSVVVTLVGQGSMTDLVHPAGSCALAIAKVWPNAVVAMATGRGVVTKELPVGEAVDRAFKMVRATETAQVVVQDHISEKLGTQYTILVDDISTGFLDGRYHLAVDGNGQTALIGEFGSDEGRRLLGQPTPCVGRDQELNLLAAAASSCRENFEANAALVVAAAGVGKSRLKHEFLRRLNARTPAHLILTTAGDMQNPGTPYSLLAKALRSHCEIQEGQPIHEQRTLLMAKLGQDVEASQREFVCDFLGELCGIRLPDEGRPQLSAARVDSRLMSEQLARAFTLYLQSQCKLGLVLVVLDDLQWGDASSVQLLDGVLRDLRDQPLLILALARSEVKERFPNLWKSHKMQEVQLKGLSKRSSQRLVEHVLGKKVDPEVIDRMLEQSAGNVLVLEELIRTVGNGRSMGTLPESVLAMVQMRIANMTLRQRRVLLAASVFGSDCWLEGVETMVAAGQETTPLDLEFDELEEAEFIEPKPLSRLSGQREYAFRNSNFREAAYGLLIDEERKNGHVLAVNWLERVGESDPMILALHSEHGGLLSAAVTYYSAAAELAFQRNALLEAISIAQRGKACGASGPILGVLCCTEAGASFLSGRVAETLQLVRQGLEVLPPASRHAHMLRVFQIFVMILGGQLGALDLFFKPLIQLEPAPEDSHVYIRYCMMVLSLSITYGIRQLYEPLITKIRELYQRTLEPAVDVVAAVHQGECDYIRALQPDLWQPWLLAQKALEGHKTAADRQMVLADMVRIGQGSAELGDVEQGMTLLREVAQMAEKDRDSYIRRMALIHMAATLAGSTNAAAWSEAEEITRDLLTQPIHAGYQGWANGILAQCMLWRQQWQEAEAKANLAIPLSKNQPLRRLWLQTLLASSMQGQGRATVQVAQQLLDDVNAMGCAGYVEVTARLAASEQFHSAGEIERAHIELRETLRQIQIRADKIPEPSWRARYLKNVAENLRARRLAHLWLSADPWQGEQDAAIDYSVTASTEAQA